jgi:hypothetical protein
MIRLVVSLSLLAALAALPGCGGGYDPRADLPSTISKDDVRAVALNCLTQHQGLQASLEGQHEITIGEGKDRPHIRFFLTGGESEARQFEGKAEGSQQIGNTLLFVGDASDDELETVEFCLDKL